MNLFSVFLWKNGKSVLFKWKSIASFHIIGLIILIVYSWQTLHVISYPPTSYETVDSNTIMTYFPAQPNDYIFYSPSSPFLDTLMDNVRINFSRPSEKLQSYNSRNDMISALEEKKATNSFGIHFEKYPGSSNSTKGLKYYISSTALKQNTHNIYFNDDDVVGIKDQDSYTQSGFFILQYLIDLNYVNYLGDNRADNKIIHIMPLPNIAVDAINNERITYFGILFVLFFISLLLVTLLVPLVEEKQDGIKEFLVLATPANYLNGLTFYIIRFGLYFMFTILAIVICNVFKAFADISLLYIIVLFTLFICANMCYAFLISVIFDTVNYASVSGSFLLIIPFIILWMEESVSKIFSYLFSLNTFMEGINVLQIYTNKRRTFSSDDLFTNITKTSFSFAAVIGILICQCVVYSILYLYLSYIFPGKGGMKRPFYFCFQSSFYKKSQIDCDDRSNNENEHAIVIRNLVKIFSNKCNKNNEVVVNNLNMDIADKRITVLLGHNGAGKTTTINMIIGSVTKTSGQIVVCNETDVASYRHKIGYCPQHSVFMQYMTCFEHLKFFAQLRGLSSKSAEQVSRHLLKLLNLQDKANKPGKKLSGGMKRRLSLGMAIAGETKVIILDEPSSGLDVESRRELWNILLELRKTKAILVTTHHMEEAEVLGDTISILSHGKLDRNGTTLELKRLYGEGYVLKILMDTGFSEENTLKYIRSIIPSAKIKNCVKPTLYITLPYYDIKKYSEVLQMLEENKTPLRITSLSMTDTSLEDIFLSTESADEIDSPFKTTDNTDVIYNRINENDKNAYDIAKMRVNQFYAVVYKKIVYIRREFLYFLFMLSIPFATTAIAIYLINSSGLLPNQGALDLNLHHASPSRIYLSILSSKEDENKIMDLLKAEVQPFNTKLEKINDGESLDNELRSIQKKSLSDFYENVIGAIDIKYTQSKPNITMLFSNNILHSSVIMLNLIDNLLLKLNNHHEEHIETTYLPIKTVSKINRNKLENYAVTLPIGLFFYMMFYVSLPFEEEKTKFKSLQAIPKAIYWLATTLFDILQHSALCGLLFIFHKFFMHDEVYHHLELDNIIITYIFYGLAFLPIFYLLASSCRSMSTLNTSLFIMLIISSLLPLYTSGNQQSISDSSGFIWILCFFPQFALNHQLRLIKENFFIVLKIEALKSKQGQFSYEQAELFNTKSFYYYMSFIFILFMFILIFFWESIYRRKKCFDYLRCKSSKKFKIESSKSDEIDGILEEQKEKEYPLLIQKLQKRYQQNLVVGGLSFAVNKGECFGLLGVNGAGKTTTFEMITVNKTISSGKIMIDGVNILTDENSYKNRFGYCPQTDCLNNFMTSYEILKYMALVRGGSASSVNKEVMYWLHQLDLINYKNVPIKYYSGGTKRKLNTAIAMIGNPSLVLLDEPTTGVDPLSRRFMWKCIQDFQKADKTVVLTSHSMDECEQLCNRLAIMARGQFQCVGNILSLKLKYGSGYTLNFRLKDECTPNNIIWFKKQIRNVFDCELREEHAGVLTFFVNETDIKWSIVFKKVQTLFEESENIVDYFSVNETTLEDIFLKFEENFGNQSKSDAFEMEILN